ncbi:MAG: response regulator [Nitrospirota bacterium]
MKKVLVIDDEPNITEIINFFANRLGYSSDASHNGESALEKVKDEKYCAVMCDLQLPGITGLEIYDRIKELNKELARKFILLTGSLLDERTEASVVQQDIKVLQKPFYFEGMKKLLAELEV